MQEVGKKPLRFHLFFMFVCFPIVFITQFFVIWELAKQMDASGFYWVEGVYLLLGIIQFILLVVFIMGVVRHTVSGYYALIGFLGLYVIGMLFETGLFAFYQPDEVLVNIQSLLTAFVVINPFVTYYRKRKTQLFSPVDEMLERNY